MNRQIAWRSRAAAPAVTLAVALAITLAVTLAAGPAAAEPVTLTIVHVNDIDRIDGSGDRGGIARLAAVV